MYAAQSFMLPSAPNPSAQYFAFIYCDIGTPTEIDMTLWHANVTTPTNYQQIGTLTADQCNVSNPCQTQTYTYVPTQTQLLRNAASFFVLGTDGNIYMSQPVQAIWPYDTPGWGYPNFNPSSSYVPFQVQFPPGPYDVCPDGTPTPPSCTRDANFLNNVTNYYTSQGWNVPTAAADCLAGDTIQAHHIKPLRWGGGNDVTNSVLLCSSDHQFYTTWWNPNNFSIAPWP